MAEATSPAASSRRRVSLRHQQQQQAIANAQREEFHARARAKAQRVTAWVAECAAAREHKYGRSEEGSTSSSSTSSSTTTAMLLGECDGETEDLLLQVLIARPKYDGIPSVAEIWQFAGQLRAYHARLWTLGMTRGFFRASEAAAAGGLLGWGSAAEYPDDIDSVESLCMREEEEEQQNWVVHENRVYVRKISPAEEELRDEMIREYRNIRRHSGNKVGGTSMRHRTASAGKEDRMLSLALTT